MSDKKDIQGPVYDFVSDNHGITDFLKILDAARQTSVPLVVFKVAIFAKEKQTAFEYRFHSATFTSILLYPLRGSKVDMKAIETLIIQKVSICTPMATIGLFEVKEVSVRVKKENVA